MNNKDMRVLFSILIFSLLVSCQSTATLLQSTADAIPDIDKISDTLTATFAAAHSSFPGPEPTSTPKDTFTPTPVSIYGDYSDIAYSPDGNYVAVKLDYYPNNLEDSIIAIYIFNGDLLWSVSFNENVMYDPHPHGRIIRWSLDSRYLYFYESFSFDGGPSIWDGYHLGKINIQSGEITYLVPSACLISFAFSSDDRYLAYVREEDDPRILFVLDLATGSDRRASIENETEEYSQAGWIHWSPDNNALVFHTLEGSTAKAIHLDVASMKQTVIAQFWEEFYGFAGWVDASTVKYISLDKNEIEIEVSSEALDELIEITPFP